VPGVHEQPTPSSFTIMSQSSSNGVSHVSAAGTVSPTHSPQPDPLASHVSSPPLHAPTFCVFIGPL
jgi:hypothetical protein